MSIRTDDPIADFERHDREQAKWEASLPKCDRCHEPITDEMCYVVYGDIYCEECMNDFHHETVNFIS